MGSATAWLLIIDIFTPWCPFISRTFPYHWSSFSILLALWFLYTSMSKPPARKKPPTKKPQKNAEAPVPSEEPEVRPSSPFSRHRVFINPLCRLLQMSFVEWPRRKGLDYLRRRMDLQHLVCHIVPQRRPLLSFLLLGGDKPIRSPRSSSERAHKVNLLYSTLSLVRLISELVCQNCQ